MKFLAGIIEFFAVHGVHFIIAQSHGVKISLGPCGGVCLHKSCQTVGIYFQLFHKGGILTDIGKGLSYKICIQIITVAERVCHKDSSGGSVAVCVSVFNGVGAEFTCRDQEGKEPAEDHHEEDDRISMRSFQFGKIFFLSRNGLLLFAFPRHKIVPLY